jgi:hypothetical protein
MLTSRIPFLLVVSGTALIPAVTGISRAHPSSPSPRTYYAAPNGSTRSDGSRAHPWDLVTALKGGPGRVVQPGDTIWLRGGTYRGSFRSTVSGAAASPVVVRQFPGERATLDGAGARASTLYVTGDYTVFWGFELTNSDPTRTTASASDEIRPNVVVNSASHTKYINLVVHDGGVAFYTEPKYVDVEIGGCIIYNNGWQGPDRGHGHGLYLKSLIGPLVARDNVLFNQYGYGVHAYTNARTGKLVNIRIEGNVSFNSGLLATQPPSAPNILLGGADYAAADVVRDNFTYFPPGVSGTNVRIGFGTLMNGDVVVEGNQLVGGVPVLELGFWTAARVSSNTLIGPGALIQRNGPTSGVGHIWRANVEERAPRATKVVVRPNPYEAGRGVVIVYNWGRDRAIPADLTGILAAADSYEVRNVQDLLGAPVVGGRYGMGPVSIPMGGVVPPAPTGLPASRAPRTGPAFDVFLVTRVLGH